MNNQLQWTLSPTNSWVFRVLAIGYVFVFGGFFLLVGTAVVAFTIFGINSMYGFLLTIVTLVLLLAYRRRSPTAQNETWQTLRCSLGTGTVVGTAIIGAVAYASTFIIIGQLFVLLFGVSGLVVGLLVGTLGGFHLEGRFDTDSGRVESGTSEVYLANVTFSQPKHVGDIVVTRSHSAENAGSTVSTLVLPEHVFQELRSELSISRSSSVVPRFEPDVSSLQGPQLLLIATGCLFALVGVGVPVLVSGQKDWILAVLLVPMGLVFVGLGLATAD